MQDKELLANVAGQLKAFELVNMKCDGGLQFYIRNMRLPFHSHDEPFDGSSIRACYELQFLTHMKRNGKDVASKMQCDYRAADWELVKTALRTQLFQYVNDSPGYKLVDSTDAFSSASDEFRKSVASGIAESLRKATAAHTIQIVYNTTEYFMGYLFLMESEDDFFELRLGAFF